MVARDDQQALPKVAHAKAPTLLEYFLEALAKRKGGDPHLQITITPSGDQNSPEPFPAVDGPASLLPLSK
jgi:hypothetical protein